MDVIVEGDQAVVHLDSKNEIWKRSPLGEVNVGFVVRIYVEGYRPQKDVWLHEKYRFNTLAEAITFYHEVNMKSYDEFNAWIKPYYNDSGWYSISREYLEIVEHTESGGKYIWERQI